MDIDVFANKELDQMETDVTSEPLPDLIPSVEKPDSRHEPETEVPSLVEKTSPLGPDVQNDTSTLDNGNTLVENGAISLEDSLATVEKTVESDIPTVENSFPTMQNPNPLIENELLKPPEETVSFAPEVQAPVPTPPPITPVKAPEESLLLDSEDEVEAETEVVIPTKKYLADNNFVLLEDVIKQGVDENNKLKYPLKGIVFSYTSLSVDSKIIWKTLCKEGERVYVYQKIIDSRTFRYDQRRKMEMPSEETKSKDPEAGYLRFGSFNLDKFLAQILDFCVDFDPIKSEELVQFGYRFGAEQIFEMSKDYYDEMFFFHGDGGYSSISKDLSESLYGRRPSEAELVSQSKRDRRRVEKFTRQRKCSQICINLFGRKYIFLPGSGQKVYLFAN